jgi:hypothetical protein
MIRNEIDDFRNNFFDKLIKEEKEKEKALKHKQANCFHKYDVEGLINENGYQQCTCSKCGHSAIKNIKVWNATKNGKCSIQ